MSEININTNTVLEVSENIAVYNKEIDSKFEAVKDAMGVLQNNWSGIAQEQAIYKFNTIKSEYFENSDTKRANTIKNYTNYLKNYVGIGYDKTETSNTSLADAFK